MSLIPSERLRFGVFLAPFHKPGINPTLDLQEDLEPMEWLDRCDHDEAWIGGRNSAGSFGCCAPTNR